MPILPRIPPGSPFPSRCFQVTPLSSERYSPLPGPPLEKNHGCRRACQMDAKTMFGLCGSKTTSIPPVFSSLDKTFVQVVAGPKYSAFCVRTKRMTKRRYEDDVLISWINN